MKRHTILASSFYLLTAIVCHAQMKTRTIDESRDNFANSPVAIVNREVAGNPVNNSRVTAGADWLRDLKLTVKNISNKPIVKFEIHLTIPKQGLMPYDAGMVFSFPQPGRVLDSTGKPTGEYGSLSTRVLEPGSSTNVQVWLHQLQILEDVKSQNVTDVSKVFLSIRQVVFKDGTGWFVGKETRQDPENPKGQIFVIGSMIPTT